MQIEKIQKLKNNRYKLNLSDGKSTIFFDEVILNNNLLWKKNIDDHEIKTLEKENSFYEFYYKAVNYISYKKRSEYEIENYLNKMELEKNMVNEIIEKLKKNNFINDLLYTKAYIADKINFSNDGPYKIKLELLDKKIDEIYIEEELSKINETIFLEKLKKMLEKKKTLNQKYSAYNFKKKMFSYFLNLGYSEDSIIQCLDNISSDDSKIVEKEYDKLYRKLSKKYSGSTLLYEIKARLYKKGFNMDDINSIKKE